jgi:two-component system, response regulator / RNA-binding antiterminator
MSSSSSTPSFENWRALILHRPHAMLDSIIRQLRQIGVAADIVWPDLPNTFDAAGYNVMFFDADMGHDSQFPWDRGAAPMPAVALIGSEAPGRVEWAIHRGADAHLLKPIAGGGIYSAMLIASHAFEQRRQLRAEVDGLRYRLSRREGLAAASAQIMVSQNVSARQAYKALRLMAMAERISIEDMAASLIDAGTAAVKRDGRA